MDELIGLGITTLLWPLKLPDIIGDHIFSWILALLIFGFFPVWLAGMPVAFIYFVVTDETPIGYL